MRFLTAIVFAASVGGCVSAQQDYVTPDFSFKNSTTKEAKGKIALQMTTDGWVVRADTETTISFRTTRFDPGLGPNLVFTCNSCQPPQADVTMLVVQDAKDVTVRYQLNWHFNPGSPFERVIQARGPRGQVSNMIEAAILRAGAAEKTN